MDRNEIDSLKNQIIANLKDYRDKNATAANNAKTTLVEELATSQPMSELTYLVADAMGYEHIANVYQNIIERITIVEEDVPEDNYTQFARRFTEALQTISHTMDSLDIFSGGQTDYRNAFNKATAILGGFMNAVCPVDPREALEERAKEFVHQLDKQFTKDEVVEITKFAAFLATQE